MITTSLGLLALASTSFAGPAARTWQEQAAIKDATAECTYYDFPPLAGLIGGYPEIWEVADLSKAGISDDVKNLYASIKDEIPNIAPRGTINGDWTGVQYDNAADPDCWWTNTGCTTPKLEGLPLDVTNCNEPMSWGFTLDDGPNCTHNEYYDYLESINQKATLFYIGSNVLDWPLEAQRGLADGHEICAHTWSHNYMTALTSEQAFAELYFTKKAIKDVVGVTVQCWRPPFGDTDDRIRFIAEKLGMRTVIWSDDTDDWNWVNQGKAKIEANYNEIISTPHPTDGIIVLSHEINAGTMELSQEFLPAIQKTFTGGVMPIAVCMNDSQPYVEQGGAYVYPNYEQWMSGTTSIKLAAPTAATKDEPLILTAASSSARPTLSTTSSSSSSSTSAAPSSSSSISSSASTSSSAQSSRSTSLVASASGAGAAAQSRTASSASVSPSSGASQLGMGFGAGLLAALGAVLV